MWAVGLCVGLGAGSSASQEQCKCAGAWKSTHGAPLSRRSLPMPLVFAGLIRSSLRCLSDLACRFPQQLAVCGDLFAVVLRCLLPENGVRSQNLFGCSTPCETLNEVHVLLETVGHEGLPFPCNHAERFLCLGICL